LADLGLLTALAGPRGAGLIVAPPGSTFLAAAGSVGLGCVPVAADSTRFAPAAAFVPAATGSTGFAGTGFSVGFVAMRRNQKLYALAQIPANGSD